MEKADGTAEKPVEALPGVLQAQPDLRAVIRELRRPFTPEAVKFKIQTNPREKNGRLSQALVVSFMDSRLAAERLNEVCPGDWSDSYRESLIPNAVVCAITVRDATREDAGYVDHLKLDSDMGLKGLYSDAFKRAAVKFGIGAFLYALPRMYVKPDQLKQAGSSWYLTAQVERDLRGRYEAWLRGEGIARFGEPLDHGDHEDGQGDPDATLDSAVAEEVVEAGQDRMNAAQYDRLKTAADAAGWPMEFIAAQLDELGVASGGDVSIRIAALSGQQAEVLIGVLTRLAREAATA